MPEFCGCLLLNTNFLSVLYDYIILFLFCQAFLQLFFHDFDSGKFSLIKEFIFYNLSYLFSTLTDSALCVITTFLIIL